MKKTIIAAAIAVIMATSASAGWVERVKTNEMTDTKDVFLTATSQTYSDRFGNTKYTRLTIRCRDNTTSAIVDTGMHMADIQGYGKIGYRVDDQKARSVYGGQSTDNEALGLWYGSKAIPFAKSLFGGEKLIIQVTPYGQNQKTLRFDIEGLETKIEQLREACHW